MGEGRVVAWGIGHGAWGMARHLPLHAHLSVAELGRRSRPPGAQRARLVAIWRALLAAQPGPYSSGRVGGDRLFRVLNEAGSSPSAPTPKSPRGCATGGTPRRSAPCPPCHLRRRGGRTRRWRRPGASPGRGETWPPGWPSASSSLAPHNAFPSQTPISTAATLTHRRPMKSRLAASEMCAASKPSVPHSSWPHGDRPTTKCHCSTHLKSGVYNSRNSIGRSLTVAVL